jgi:hypothetical protein
VGEHSRQAVAGKAGVDPGYVDLVELGILFRSEKARSRPLKVSPPPALHVGRPH